MCKKNHVEQGEGLQRSDWWQRGGKLIAQDGKESPSKTVQGFGVCFGLLFCQDTDFPGFDAFPTPLINRITVYWENVTIALTKTGGGDGWGRG